MNKKFSMSGESINKTWRITSAEGLEFLEKDARFDIYYVYQALYSSQVWAKKSPFTIRNYSLDSEGGLSVYELEAKTWTFWNNTRVNMVAILKSTELPEGWNLVGEEVLHLSSDKWIEIKSLHPYYAEYGEGENNFKIEKRNQKTANTLGDFFDFENLKK